MRINWRKVWADFHEWVDGDPDDRWEWENQRRQIMKLVNAQLKPRPTPKRKRARR